jgi:hypothetical protein
VQMCRCLGVNMMMFQGCRAPPRVPEACSSRALGANLIRTKLLVKAQGLDDLCPRPLAGVKCLLRLAVTRKAHFTDRDLVLAS